MEKDGLSRIHILDDSVARKIAAGEVIDRPFSVVRELLDNSLDSGATEIELHLLQGGLESIRVVDNGCGMSARDMEVCWLPHATSKISTETDLDSLRTLGFRGEALSSIATVSKLEIISSTDYDTPYRILVHGGRVLFNGPSHGKKGTNVEVTDLFFSLPGRKKFLKRSSSEALLCKGIFLDKAVAFPDVSFRFFSDTEMKMFLPHTSLKERVSHAFRDQIETAFLHEVRSEDEGITIQTILTSPDVFRKDRKYIQIFVNRRRIYDFSLVQAVEYGFSEYMPGGRFPAAFVFIDISPELVDFNIHPAKREARFRNIASIHHSLSNGIRSFLRVRYGKRIPNAFTGNSTVRDASGLFVDQGPGSELRPGDAMPGFSESSTKAASIPEGSGIQRTSFVTDYTGRKGFPSYSDIRDRIAGEVSENAEFRNPDPQRYRYLGQVFTLFLAVENEDRLILIDQHAAHERIIFDRLISSTPSVQPLLVPFSFEVSDDEVNLIEKNIGILERTGLRFEKSGENLIAVTAVPDSYKHLLQDIVDWVRGEGGSLHDADKGFFATMACRSAVKDGDVLDELTAREIIRGAFELKTPRCPHGRPVWIELNRTDLLRLVERI